MTDNRTTDLKPCPFCGGEAVLLEPNESSTFYRVGCNCAHCIGANAVWHAHTSEAEAIAAWNTRYHCGLTDEDYNILLDELGVSERTCYADEVTHRDCKYSVNRGWKERTCRNLAEPDEMNDRPFTCSECGARGPYGEGTYHIGGCEEKEDGSVVFWDSWPVYKYCPNCGRRVIE